VVVVAADGYRKEKILIAYYILKDKNQSVNDKELLIFPPFNGH
jgi:hypothetical protein